MEYQNNYRYYNPIFDYEKKFPVVDEISGWVGHKFFIYDFIRNFKPKIITELGTHYGASFFSMCQAVKDGKLKTKLYAIDTWKGDKHTGFYDESVFNEVNKIKKTYYLKQNITFIRSLFDDAIVKFKNNSIDLLHIDGLHTYEAVKHDFDNWFNKVTENGVIIIHDTHERRDDFGVFKLWKELKKQFKTIEFPHSHGLGVLFKNPQSFSKLFDLQEVWQHYYLAIFENRILQKEVKKLNEQNPNQKKLLEQLQQLIQENISLQTQLQQIKTHNQNLENTLNMIKSAKFFKLWQTYNKILKFLRLKS